MGIRSWFKTKKCADLDCVVIAPSEEAVQQASIPPMQQEIKEAQHDFVQTIVALGRANARARKLLAAQTLVNVQGKTGYATHR